jgi:AraC family transcriptional regulator
MSASIAKHADNRQIDAGFVIAQTSRNRVDSLNSLTVKDVPCNDFVIAEMLRSNPNHGLTEQQQRMESYTAGVHLSRLDDLDVWCDDRHVSTGPIHAGTVHISDMRHEWRADIRSPFHVVNFCIPQSALDAIASEQGGDRVEELNCPIRSAQSDPVLKNLTLALLPALVRPEQTNRLFTDYTVRAVIVHLAKCYGSLRIQAQRASGGLVPWQERRAKELLIANLSGNISLRDLASACRLSTGHFSQAFRRTVGCPPHQWLLTQRVERAKHLILNTKQSLGKIAIVTGFADQSHFTRVFTQRAKISPTTWRRTQVR